MVFLYGLAFFAGYLIPALILKWNCMKLRDEINQQENKIRSQALSAQEHVERYIQKDGYQPPWTAKSHFWYSLEFCEANQLRYINPSEIISCYESKVIADYQEILSENLLNIGMFDMDQLYYEPISFQFRTFFNSPEEKKKPFVLVLEMPVEKAAQPVVDRFITEGKLKTVGGGNIYQSTESASPANLEEEHTWSDDDFA